MNTFESRLRRSAVLFALCAAAAGIFSCSGSLSDPGLSDMPGRNRNTPSDGEDDKSGGGDGTVDTKPVTGVTLDRETLTLTAGGQETLTATVSPDNATDKSVTWESDNEGVATVNDSGLVTAVAEGYAKITVTTTDGGFTASCGVTVVRENTGAIIKEVAITGTAEVGRTLTAIAKDANDKTITDAKFQWKQADSKDGGYSDISGATDETYTLAEADKGKYIKVEADNEATDNPVLSGAIGPVTAASDEPVVGPPHTVSFDSNGGSEVAVQTVTHGGKVKKPDDPVKSGYIFEGWYKDSGLSARWDFVNDTVTADITLYAKWKENRPGTFTVSFNSNGGSAISNRPVESGGKVKKPDDPVRKGYTFAGWYKDSALSAGWDFDVDTVTADITLYAKWTAITYSITYNNVDGGSGKLTPTSYTIESEAITLPRPAKSGCTFSGWYDNSSLTGIPVTVIPHGSTGNKTFWAKWTENKYTVTFDSNGGGTPVPASKSVTYGGTYGELAAVEKPGYKFLGWYTAASGGTQVDASTIVSITADQTLYAQWSEKAEVYTITYHLNGGAGTENGSYTVEAAVTLPTDVVKTGYTFNGWYENSAFSGSKVTTIPAGSTGNKTFWAKWTAITYSITYNLNGGSGTMTPTSYTVESASITLPVPSKNRYIFCGWYDNSGLTGSEVTSILHGSTGNKTFWAKWIENSFNLSTGTGTGTGWTYASNTLTILNGGNVRIYGSTRNIRVRAEGTSEIVLDTATINVRLQSGVPAIDVASGASLTLSCINGGSHLSRGAGAAGINVPKGSSLRIEGAEESTARDTVYLHIDGANAPGIGSVKAAGAITIAGGNVSVTGGGDAPGIGGASGSDAITITGGYVNSSATGQGAGIGGAYKSGATVNISGGTVVARAGWTGCTGAGIGSGGGEAGLPPRPSPMVVVKITGGAVTATGHNGSAGIGGGIYNSGGTITISGGHGKATGSDIDVKGVGPGKYGKGGSFWLNGIEQSGFPTTNPYTW